MYKLLVLLFVTIILFSSCYENKTNTIGYVVRSSDAIGNGLCQFNVGGRIIDPILFTDSCNKFNVGDTVVYVLKNKITKI